MNRSEIESLVDSIMSQTILDDWYFYLLLFFVSLLGAMFGSFIKGFSLEKGKYQAIESSLSTIKKQISETTKVTEEIKNDIELSVWKKKDREMLKRAKLEEYILLILVCKDALHDEMENKLFRRQNKYDDQAFNKADIIQALYLPEISEEHNYFRIAVVNFRDWMTDGMSELLEKRINGDTELSISKEHMEKYGAIMRGFNQPLTEVVNKARELAKQINT